MIIFPVGFRKHKQEVPNFLNFLNHRETIYIFLEQANKQKMHVAMQASEKPIINSLFLKHLHNKPTMTFTITKIEHTWYLVKLIEVDPKHHHQ
jgi:hypothetical protein